MRLTLTLHGIDRGATPVDVDVTWSGRHTAATLCGALAAQLRVPVGHLVSGGTPVPDDAVVGMPPLLHGASVVIGSGAPPERAPRDEARGVIELVAVGGPDSARSHRLAPPGLAVGRSPASGLRLADDTMSRVHARLDVGAAGVVLDDCATTNGTTVDGSTIDGPVAIDTTSTIVLGATTLRLRRTAGAGLPVVAVGDGTLVITPSGRLPAPPTEGAVDAPAPPTVPVHPPVPWLAALLPVVAAGILAMVIGPMMLAFALLGPAVLLGNAAGDRWGARRRHQRALADHDLALRKARKRLRLALQEEARQRHLQHPDAHALLQIAEHRLPGLWAADLDLSVRLGLGDVPARTSWVEGSRSTRQTATGVPVVVDLADVGCLGVVGLPADTDGILTHLVGQLVVRMPPGRLRVTAWQAPLGWAWSSRLPQVSSPETTEPELVIVPDVTTTGAAAAVIAARERGAVVLLASTRRESLPEPCGATLEPDTDATHRLTTPAGEIRLIADVVGSWWADRLARALAPLRSRAEVSATLPHTVDLPTALGLDELTVQTVLDRWSGGSCPPAATVGVARDGPHVVDLRRDGPHLLIGGTTGSGKSEFLRSLVAGLALACPPDELSLVLVDFKGGAAFGACAGLPHVVGLVTDLADHLVDRALASLGAELRRRERMFAAVGASDIDDYHAHQTSDRPRLPRLVVVVDELRALVDELPEFVTGLVRLAAQGRSLGIHLVLATQRPTGTITAEIRANVALRIAFRVRDRSDSIDVIDEPGAAALPASTPGRALARGADGSLVEFQSALVAPGAGRGTHHLAVTTTARADGQQAAASQPAEDRAAATDAVVDIIRAAHSRHGTDPAPAPWLPPLPTVVTTGLTIANATASADVVAIVDEPERQRVTTVRWDAARLWRMVGKPRSGRSTALRALVSAAVRSNPPDQLHVHVIDASGGLHDLASLPHVGTYARGDDEPAIAALTTYLRGIVERRATHLARFLDPAAEYTGAAGPREPAGPTVLVVADGWEALTEHAEVSAPTSRVDTLLGIFRDGPAVGVVGAVAGGRVLLGPRWSALGGAVYLLGNCDVLDAAVTGVPARTLPQAPPVGRAVRVSDARDVQFVSAGTAHTWPTPVGPGDPASGSTPWRYRPLPAVLRPGDLAASPGNDPAPTSDSATDHALVLGVGGPQAEPWTWHPDRDGRRLLVVGPPRSGRTNLLRVIGRAARQCGSPVAVVSRFVEEWSGERHILIGPGEVDRLISERATRPELVVLVDNSDHLEADLLPVLQEVAELAERDRGFVAASTTPGSLATRLRGLDIDLAQHRAAIVLRPGPGDTETLGCRGATVGRDIPGRGVSIVRGIAAEVHVLLANPAGARSRSTGNGVVRGPRQQGRHERGECDEEDDRTQYAAVGLRQGEPDRKQQQIPGQGRAPGPDRTAQPPSAERRERHRGAHDERTRDEDPHRTAPPTDHEFVGVEEGQAGKHRRLDDTEQAGQAGGAAPVRCRSPKHEVKPTGRATELDAQHATAGAETPRVVRSFITEESR
jgi:DNA segregation ATPase FtsK/SpoIIIE, S-DNA-T family